MTLITPHDSIPATSADELPVSSIAPFKRKARPRHLVQFAIEGAAPLPTSEIVAVTTAFRSRVTRHALMSLTGQDVRWSDATPEMRYQVRLLAGREPGSAPLRGHEHLRVLLWFEGAIPTRLFVHRDTPLLRWEVAAILKAAEEPLHRIEKAETGIPVPLLPLGEDTAPPPGFDGTASKIWSSVTELLSPLPVGDSADPTRALKIEDVLSRELVVEGHPSPRLVEERGDPGGPDWVRATHRRREGAYPRRHFRLRLTFGEPIPGPLLLGQSTDAGLGLFRPE